MATLGQDILTTAVEGGIGYWFQITDAKRTEELDWVEVTGHELNDDESTFDGDKHTIKASSLVKAARELVKAKAVNSRIAAGISHTLNLNEISADFDSDCADCIVQYAVFGKVVYG